MKQMKKMISITLHYLFWSVLVLSFVIGVCGADSFAEQGYFWLLFILVFAPFVIGYIGVKYFGMGKHLKDLE